MWEAIRKNAWRSRVLIALLGLLYLLLGAILGGVYLGQFGPPIGAGIAGIVWLVMIGVTFAAGDRMLLASARAYPIEKRHHPVLWNTVEEMTIAAGLSRMPKVYIIEDDAPNAFAVGRKPETASVAVTTGLLARLNRDELQGVVAHEIGHIVNLDVRFMTIASISVGGIVMLSDLFWRSLFHGGGRRLGGRRGGFGKGALPLIVIAIVLAIIAPFIARILYFACSRGREYLADASAARYTRYPEGLASALEKIAAKARPLKETNRALAPLFIVCPLQSAMAFNFFSTHPPIERRIAILRGMSGGAGYADYEGAYRRIVGAGEHLIGARTLAADGAQSVGIREATPEPETSEAAIQRAHEVVDMLDTLGHFIAIPCECGVGIKIPPTYLKEAIGCPRCGRQHNVPRAVKDYVDQEQKKPGPDLHYRRLSSGWETFQCECGHNIQLSPKLLAPRIECPKCRRGIRISA